MAKSKVLVADDDPNVCEIIRLYFQENNFDVIEANNGRQALTLFASDKPDIILLDIMMPDIDGYEVCREIRKKADIPIIMLSAKAEEVDRVLGLEIGADDYVTKPFSPREILARIKAIFRRTSVQPSNGQEELYHFQDFDMNVNRREVIVKGNNLFLRPKEFDLLVYLVRHSQTVVTREQLLEHVWGYDYIGDIRTVDVHIKRIRSEFDQFDIGCIKTVWGVGYQFQCSKN
ncbi:two component transcriptional regulator [Halalkalibacter wakoensis JCM 9140]|uniref:Two component transcriptional regulator n=1 Tax=Halalkalibacter wakoensis JCM 9140 TaxID=1236970 RepID=W4PXE8_9BACI|nr:response regulator transcription factor [Halalkalibacter wakoensis]GAE24516.1 two component transcriptional regulator [Halalkalibacter wakoensis JCM 9140]